MHGDWASVDENRFWFLHGRSDDTRNIAGKRVGPAELESAAVGHPAVREAAAVGIPHEVKGEVAWLFCVLAGREGSDELAAEIADAVAGELGKAFRPERVLFVSALPKPRSAKIVRGRSARRRSARISATCRRSRIPRRSTRSRASSSHQRRPAARPAPSR